MLRHPSIAWIFIPQGVRVGASVGAVVLCAALIGATASPAATQPGEMRPPAAHGRLQIRFTTADPLVLPPAPSADDRMAVLADVPADLTTDPDLSSSRDLAVIREADAVQAHDAQAQAALWVNEEARMQAQIDAAIRPQSGSRPARVADVRPGGDPELTASAGDTRLAPSAN